MENITAKYILSFKDSVFMESYSAATKFDVEEIYEVDNKIKKIPGTFLVAPVKIFYTPSIGMVPDEGQFTFDLVPFFGHS